MEIPENIGIIEAAAIPEAWLTAYQLCQISKISKDDTVLVHAAASGVGTALIQLIKHFKAKSIGICSNPEKINFCEK
jgi:tumor protein p53-inducible protein 3